MYEKLACTKRICIVGSLIPESKPLKILTAVAIISSHLFIIIVSLILEVDPSPFEGVDSSDYLSTTVNYHLTYVGELPCNLQAKRELARYLTNEY